MWSRGKKKGKVDGDGDGDARAKHYYCVLLKQVDGSPGSAYRSLGHPLESEFLLFPFPFSLFPLPFSLMISRQQDMDINILKLKSF